MNNIRQIIEERLDNAKMVYRNASEILELKGQIEAYQDCLNLLPAPRTEADILNDFEKLGWEITTNDYYGFIFKNKRNEFLKIYNLSKTYRCECNLSIQEHKLLNELLNLWGVVVDDK